ncbi:dTDP-4-dehydrorhamnose reductase [Cryptosporangium aurantiacum]|uniref:dTDP-4-dehydrorhamnose reductase n=1 Tax=Cryptosporangium aurantiacum TaxID=134849 RepID=A0A1M7RIY4_9ACTN|nr:dTDP-4-dehydrorhamnose reductase [Cryptosporangium aurantiacum]SHN46091.1 dTDP-4-dehydrorhamnose reductase [Cryptosporangium aurantiacum]
MRWLITGAGGALGHDLVVALRDADVTAATRAVLDITDRDAVRAAVAGHDVVVNAAAYTAVDNAEADEDEATRINGHGPALLADACAATGAVLLQISTDYVLPGDATTPCPEDAATNPVNAYGRSKLAGEQAVLTTLPDRGYVVRTAWLYGETGNNFVATMLKLAATRPTVSVVDDQHGQPTWTSALAAQLVALGSAARDGEAAPGVYHGTASGQTTWHGLTRAIYALAGLNPARVETTTSDAFPRPAKRPAYSVLGHDRWAAARLAPQPHWHDQLEEALKRPSFVRLVEAAGART